MNRRIIMTVILSLSVALTGCSIEKGNENTDNNGAGVNVTNAGNGEVAGAENDANVDASQDGGDSGDKDSIDGKENNAVNNTTKNEENDITGKGGKEGNALAASNAQIQGLAVSGSVMDTGTDDSWKEIYADFMEHEAEDQIGYGDPNWMDGWSFGFIYLNDDTIPELVMGSGYEAAGNVICSPVDGKVDYIQTSRLNFFYQEFSGVLDNADGNMGYYHDLIYKLDDSGFSLIHEGENFTNYDEDGNICELYFAMDGKELTEEEYTKIVEDVIPPMQRVFWAQGCTYEDMLEYLKGNTASDYKEAYRKLIKNGVKGFSEDLNYFALIERENFDPMLLCAGENEYRFCSFEDGLLLLGPATFFSETDFVLVYPKLGIIESNQFYENNEMYNARYFLKAGSVVCNYANSTAQYDLDYEPILDTAGVPIVTYKINSSVVTKEQFSKRCSEYDEIFKQQLASPKEDYTFIEYSNSAQMYDMLEE